MDTAAQASLCTGIVSISSRRKFYKRCCIVFLITPLPFLFSYHFLLFSFFNVFFFTLFLLFSSFLLSYCFLLFSFITPFFLLSDLIGHGTVEYGEFYSFYLTSRYVLVNKFFLQIFSLFVFSYLPMWCILLPIKIFWSLCSLLFSFPYCYEMILHNITALLCLIWILRCYSLY